MNGIHSRPSLKTVVAVLTIACFLAFAQGGVSGALAEEASTSTTAQAQAPAPTPAPSDTWETWPKKAPEGGGAAEAGKAAGAKTSSGMSAGTIALITLGVAAAIAIGVAAAGNGGSDTTPTH